MNTCNSYLLTNRELAAQLELRDDLSDLELDLLDRIIQSIDIIDDLEHAVRAPHG